MVKGKTEGEGNTSERKICPRCRVGHLHEDEVMNCLSRRDNKTYICERCGQQEAMIDWASSQKPKEERDNIILKDCVWLLPHNSKERAVDILSKEQEIWVEKGGDTQSIDEEKKQLVILKRVSYSSDKTPVDMREYKIEGQAGCPVGTIQEWKKWASTYNYELIIPQSKDSIENKPFEEVVASKSSEMINKEIKMEDLKEIKSNIGNLKIMTFEEKERKKIQEFNTFIDKLIYNEKNGKLITNNDHSWCKLTWEDKEGNEQYSLIPLVLKESMTDEINKSGGLVTDFIDMGETK